MASPTSPRVFNLYDILGVMVPGITVLTGLLLNLPEPPAPSEFWEYLLYGIVAFSLGYVVQSWASKAGEQNTFEITMDEVRNPLESPETEGESTQSDSKPDSGDTDEANDDGGGNTGDENERDRTPESDEDQGRNRQSTGTKRRIRYAFGHILYAFLGPILWWHRSPTARSIGNSLHANRVWRDLRDTYNLERGTDDYEELQQMIQSEIDNVRSPSRAYRFQAIRNFHRGMWISLWIVSVLMAGYFVNDYFLGFEISFIHGAGKSEPYVLQQGERWSMGAPLAVPSLVVFWRLHVEFQRKFVRYLIIDYYVKLRERGEVDT